MADHPEIQTWPGGLKFMDDAEITPEMIEAGVDALCLGDMEIIPHEGQLETAVRAVFVAMTAARRFGFKAD